MGECKQCGECCKWLSFTFKGVGNNRLYREFYTKRGCKIVGDAILVPQRCQYLDENNKCKIYPRRPFLCKAFKGQSKGYWVPPKCGYRE